MFQTSTSKRIAKNTLMLYFRQVLIMLVSLYSVRVVLNVLGVVDYGIYTVVAGMVTMFSFLSVAMSTASQRYFSFELGKGNDDQLRRTFKMSFTIYVIIAFIVVIFAETIGLWFVHNMLAIPADRIFAARFVYQMAVISFVFTILTSPYMAAIIAHEDMNIYAYVSIFESILKLGIVFLLSLINIDKLIIYSILMTSTVIIVTATYRTICKTKYNECRAMLYWDPSLFKEMISFTGWNLFGASVNIFKIQAVNILLNQHFNPIVIASRGIATQVNSAVISFSQSFSTAVRPQIVKNFASGNMDEMRNLVYRSCKGTFFLMYLFILPLCLEINFVLQLWLKFPPRYVYIFTQLTLIDALIASASYPLIAVAQATGKVKLYQGVVAGILLLNMPLAYVSIIIGLPVESIFFVGILLTSIALIVRIVILGRLLYFPFKSVLNKVILPIGLSTCISYIIPAYLQTLFTESFLRFILITLISLLSVSVTGYFIMLSKDERFWIKEKITRPKRK